MLVDMADGQLSDTSAYGHARKAMDSFTEYQAFVEAHGELTRTVGCSLNKRVAKLLTTILEARTCYFVSLIQGHHFFQYWNSVVMFETLRTHVLLHDLQATDNAATDVLFWQDKQDELLKKDTVASLHLTTWQMQSMLMPGRQCSHVLTSTQDNVFREKIAKGLSTQGDAGPLEIPSLELPPGLVRDSYSSLFKCFSDALPALASDPAPEPSSMPPSYGAHNTTPPSPKQVSGSLHRAASPRHVVQSPVENSPSPFPNLPVTESPSRTSSNKEAGLGELARARPQAATPWSGASPSLKRSAFAGITCIPSKRRDSGSGRNAKMPRLDLQETFKAGLDQLQQELKTEANEGREALRKDLECDRAQVFRSATDIMLKECASLRSEVVSIRTELGSSIDRLRAEIVAGLASSKEALQADLEEKFASNLGQLCLV